MIFVHYAIAIFFLLILLIFGSKVIYDVMSKTERSFKHIVGMIIILPCGATFVGGGIHYLIDVVANFFISDYTYFKSTPLGMPIMESYLVITFLITVVCTSIVSFSSKNNTLTNQ